MIICDEYARGITFRPDRKTAGSLEASSRGQEYERDCLSS